MTDKLQLIKKAVTGTDTPTDVIPGLPTDNQQRDPLRFVFFTYEVAKPSDKRVKFIFASAVKVTSQQATLGAISQIKSKIALLEGISSFQVSEWGEEYWRYSNATVLSHGDAGSADGPPLTASVGYYDCVSWGWNMTPLENVLTRNLSSDVLDWKLNIFFGWDPPTYLSPDDDFICSRDVRNVPVDEGLHAIF